MTNDDFGKIRRAARITSVEVADAAGCSVRHMLDVESGDWPVQGWMVDLLNRMIAERALSSAGA